MMSLNDEEEAYWRLKGREIAFRPQLVEKELVRHKEW